MIDFTERIETEIYQAITRDEDIDAAFTVDNYSRHPLVEIGAVLLEQETFPKQQWYGVQASIRIEAKFNNAKQEVNELSDTCIALLKDSFENAWQGMLIHGYGFSVRRDKFLSSDDTWIQEKDITVRLLIELKN